MEHLTEKQLLEALKPENGPGTGDILNHLSECVDCQQRLTELQQTWDMLGAWTIEVPDIDLTDRIVKKIKVPPIRTVHLWESRTLVHIAASIIIGMGLGGLLGRPAHPVVSADEVARSMYLDVLTLDSSTGWTSPLLQGISEEP